MKLVAIACGFLSWLFLVIAYGNWNAVCFQTFSDNVKIYNGLGCTVAAWIITLLILGLHVCVPVSLVSPSSSSSPLSTQNASTVVTQQQDIKEQPIVTNNPISSSSSSSSPAATATDLKESSTNTVTNV